MSPQGTSGTEGQRRWIYPLHGFTDLDQPQPDCIEYQPVDEVTSLLVCPNGSDGVDSVSEPLTVVAAHN
jgi:hypothetical protein